MGKSPPPEPDPNIGKAAMASAQTGQDYLAFMKDQAAVTNEWAATDRARYKTVFEPLQDQYIADAKAGPDYSGVNASVRRAGADMTRQFDLAQTQEQRRLASMGVNPASGRGTEATRRSEITEALGTAGAKNSTRLAETARAEAVSDAKMANAINLGSGMAVNPGSSMGLSSGATSSGFSGAMQGYNQQGSLLNVAHGQKMDVWQAQQAQSASFWGGVGQIAGLGVSLLSSKDAKENKRPARSVLSAVREMPVEEWDYKEGMADGGSHIGPYAEDFQAKTGRGDGKSIPVVDAIGVTMKAVQELADKVDTLAGKGAQAGGGRKPAARRKGRSVMMEGIAAA